VLKEAIVAELGPLADDQHVRLKLTLPDEDDLYHPLVEHPKVLLVEALLGGYPREEANERMARNKGVVARFSRAFTEGLSVDQSDQAFDATLDASTKAIFEASLT